MAATYAGRVHPAVAGDLEQFEFRPSLRWMRFPSSR